MALHKFHITRVYSVPKTIVLNGKEVPGMIHYIGNSISHRYFIAEDDGSVHFLMFSSTKDEFVELNGNGPVPKLGDNIAYKCDGYNTKWWFIKPPADEFTRAIFYSTGAVTRDEGWQMHWAKHGDIENDKIRCFDTTMTYESFIKRFKRDAEESESNLYAISNDGLVHASAFINRQWGDKLMPQFGHFVAPAEMKGKIDLVEAICGLAEKLKIGQIVEK